MSRVDEPGLDVSRRRLIKWTIAVVAVVGVGAHVTVSSYRHGRQGWIADVLARNLKNVRVSSESIRRLLADLKEQDFFDRYGRYGRFAMLASQTFPSLARLAIVPETLERIVVTQFLLGSDFLTVRDPLRQEISYLGRPVVCSNPFAVFRNE